MGIIQMLDTTGDTKVIWDKNNDDETQVARDTFNKLKKKGFTAYSVKKDGEKKEIVSEFDPDAERLIMVPRVVGG